MFENKLRSFDCPKQQHGQWFVIHVQQWSNIPQRNLCSQHVSSSSTVLVNSCMSRLIEEDYKRRFHIRLAGVDNDNIFRLSKLTTEGFMLCSFIPLVTRFTSIVLSSSAAFTLFLVKRHSRSRTLFLIEHVP